mmetsp:Transcript_91717/g.163240  ORF Transcript_91717/g.163240 Transcript_91717/m.163240 type:complete len:156 (+) Transcript_91717:78-545(+)
MAETWSNMSEQAQYYEIIVDRLEHLVATHIEMKDDKRWVVLTNSSGEELGTTDHVAAEAPDLKVVHWNATFVLKPQQLKLKVPGDWFGEPGNPIPAPTATLDVEQFPAGAEARMVLPVMLDAAFAASDAQCGSLHVSLTPMDPDYRPAEPRCIIL